MELMSGREVELVSGREVELVSGREVELVSGRVVELEFARICIRELQVNISGSIVCSADKFPMCCTKAAWIIAVF